jgi:plasmid stability protein
VPKTTQLRNVPDALHRKLKMRAARQGTSLSEYLRQEIELIAERSTLQETLAEIANLPPATWGEPLAQTIRRLRDRR